MGPVGICLAPFSLDGSFGGRRYWFNDRDVHEKSIINRNTVYDNRDSELRIWRPLSDWINWDDGENHLYYSSRRPLIVPFLTYAWVTGKP